MAIPFSCSAAASAALSACSSFSKPFHHGVSATRGWGRWEGVGWVTGGDKEGVAGGVGVGATASG